MTTFIFYQFRVTSFYLPFFRFMFFSHYSFIAQIFVQKLCMRAPKGFLKTSELAYLHFKMRATQRALLCQRQKKLSRREVETVKAARAKQARTYSGTLLCHFDVRFQTFYFTFYSFRSFLERFLKVN